MDAQPAFTLVLALAVGILMQSLARHLRVPGIVLLLFAGAFLGPDGLGWIVPRSLGEGLLVIVNLAVAVILFEGGLNLEISRLRRAQAPIRRLVTLGAAVTMVGGALAVHAFYEVSFVKALLFGSLYLGLVGIRAFEASHDLVSVAVSISLLGSVWLVRSMLLPCPDEVRALPYPAPHGREP